MTRLTLPSCKLLSLTRFKTVLPLLLGVAVSGQLNAQAPATQSVQATQSENQPLTNKAPETQTALQNSAVAITGPVILQEGTIISVELLDTVGSKLSKQGDIFRMKTTADVSVQGIVVIPAGSMGYGTITYAEPRRMLGQAGELFYRFDYIKIGERLIKIRSAQGGKGKDSTGSTVALVALFGVFGMLKKGADIEVLAGTQFEVYNATNVEFNH